MLKIALAAAALTLITLSPAQAAGKLKCNSSSMQKVEMMIGEAMKNPKMKKAEMAAMEENKMAGELKKKGDTKGCAMHLNMAQETLMKKG